MERTRQPCPFVDCGSRDAFTYNTEKMVGKCFSCDSGYPSKAGREVFDWAYEDYPTSHMNSGERNTMTITQNVWTRTGTNLTEVSAAGYRGVTPATMKLYGVKSVVDRQSAESVGHAYPYPSGGFKVRKYPKDFFVDNFKSDELFGMDKFNGGSSKVVVVTEGELDAMSGYQMTGSKYPFVSLPSATPSRKLWQNEKVMKFLKSFDKILMSVDSDGKSNGIVNKLSILFPNKVYVVPHDKYKDANEFLEAGASAAYNSAFFNAKKYVPENVFNTTEQFLKIVNEDEDSSYLPTYIQGFDDLALGLMRGHFTVFSAPEGIGKTEFMRKLEHTMLRSYPEVPIAICHMEETKKRSILGLVSYWVNKNVTRTDLIDDKQEVDTAIKEMSERENLFQFSLGVDEDPMSILDRIRYFAEGCGCQYIFFEPIQDLAYSRQTDQSTEAWLSELSTKLARLASELNVGIVTIAHENDDGQIRDCRMIGKRASVVVRLKRDKMHEDEDERNTTELLLVKNRPAGATGCAGWLKFDEESFTLHEVSLDNEI